MNPEIVIAMYSPHPGKEEALRPMLTEHGSTLHRLELITDRPVTLARSENGTYLEVFEWRSSECARLAHEHPAVARIWDAMGQVSDFATLSSLDEANRPFPHFQPVDLDRSP